MRAAAIGVGAAAAGALALLLLSPAGAAAGWRIAFLTAGAPIAGVVLLLAIARVTGARWAGIAPMARAAPLLVPMAALLGAAQIAIVPPPHLAMWMAPPAVGARAIVVAGLFAWVGRRLAAGASLTFAAIALAVYAWIVTPLGADWMMGHVPGHPVSAAGMMLVVEQIAGGCAGMLIARMGDERTRADLARLMIAAALGLAYLAFMDFVIVWFGNLPARIPFYLARSGPGGAALVWSALALGLAAPIAALSLARSQRLAGGAVLMALLLFNLWWVGGGIVAALTAAAGIALVGAGTALLVARTEAAHG